MKNKILFLLLFFPVMFFGQENICGNLVSDSFPVSDVFIINKNNKSTTLSGETGKFCIAAQPGDTLIVGGLSFKSAHIALKTQHFGKPFEIRLQPEMYLLEEVVVSRYKLTGDLERDSRHIPEKIDTLAMMTAMIKDAANRSTKEYPAKALFQNIPGVNEVFTPMGGADLVALVNLIGGLFKSDKTKKKAGPYDGMSFSEAVTMKYPVEFFTRTLQLSHAESLRFIAFCDEKNPDMSLFDKGRELELLEFILTLHREFVTR